MTTSEERKNLYAATRADLLVRQLSNSENFDKAILSLSTGGLGISLVFIKDVVPIKEAVSINLLTASWYLFAAAIIATLFSFVSSQISINKQLVFAEKYYLDEEDQYLKKKNWYAKVTNYLNYSAGFIFVLAVALTIMFVSSNIKGEHKMSKDTSGGKTQVNEGAPIPVMQKVSEPGSTRGATIPDMQPVSTGGGSQQGGSTQSSGNNSSSSNNE